MHLQVGCAIPGKYAVMPQNSPPYSLAVAHVTQTYMAGEAPKCIPGKCRMASLLKFLNREGKHQALKGQESKAHRHSIEVGALPRRRLPNHIAPMAQRAPYTRLKSKQNYQRIRLLSTI